MSPPPLLRAQAFALVLLIAAACGGGSDETDSTGPSAPAGGMEVAATPTPQWPEVARATITTEDLNVRTGPGSAYPVVGRLQPNDEVPVAGRLAGGEWLALPGIGWIVYDEEWMSLSTDVGALPEITEPERTFEFSGPVHAADGRSDIPVVDQVVVAVVSRDRTLLLSLTSAPAPPAATPAATGTPFPTLVPDVTEALASPTAAGTATPSNCADEPVPGDQLGKYLDALYHTEVPAAARGEDGQGLLRLYGVVRGPVPQTGNADYVVVFAFERGEGRQVWVSPEGRLTQFTVPCEPTLPGSLLRVTMGEPFFWLRPPVQPPVHQLP
jgi:hypothetical protein